MTEKWLKATLNPIKQKKKKNIYYQTPSSYDRKMVESDVKPDQTNKKKKKKKKDYFRLTATSACLAI